MHKTFRAQSIRAGASQMFEFAFFIAAIILSVLAALLCAFELSGSMDGNEGEISPDD